MRDAFVLLALSAAIGGCAPPRPIGSVTTKVEHKNGVETCVFEVENMSIAETIEAINQFLPKGVSIDPRVDSGHTVGTLSLRGQGWQDILNQVDAHLPHLQIIESDTGLTLVPTD